MPELTAEAIRELTDEEIGERLEQVEDELFRLKFRSAYEELENPSLLRSLRRDVARLKTIRHERLLAKESSDE